MKRQIAMVIAAMLAAVLMLSACGGKSSEEPQEASQPVEEAEEPVEEVKEEAEVTPEPEPAEITPEAVPEEKEDLSPMYTAYLKTVKANEDEIKNYDWQQAEIRDQEMDWESNQKRIALENIYGDEKPELLYITAPESEDEYSYEAFLHICTWENEEVKELYNNRIDVAAGGGMYYVLFLTEGSPNLHDVEDYGDEGWVWVYGDYKPEDGKIVKEDVLKKTEGPDENYVDTVRSFYSEGNEIEEDEFLSKEREIKDSVQKIVLYSGAWDEDFKALIKEKGVSGYTYDEAVEELVGLGAVETVEEEQPAVSEDVSFADVAGNYAFLSGVGGWSTDMTIREDGTFTGFYHDSDMGDSGDGYDATVYECEFSGKFDGLTRIDDNTLTMNLTELGIENPPGEEYIDEEMTRHIYSTPYGISESGDAYGQEFRVYLPGASAESLPEEYITWVSMPGLDESGAPLNKGIYNVDEQLGWFCTDELE